MDFYKNKFHCLREFYSWQAEISSDSIYNIWNNIGISRKTVWRFVDSLSLSHTHTHIKTIKKPLFCSMWPHHTSLISLINMPRLSLYFIILKQIASVPVCPHLFVFGDSRFLVGVMSGSPSRDKCRCNATIMTSRNYWTKPNCSITLVLCSRVCLVFILRLEPGTKWPKQHSLCVLLRSLCCRHVVAL